MLFSEQFGISRGSGDSWFDPILTVDTPLFVDPLLVASNEFGAFTGSHDELIGFFNTAFQLIATAHGDPASQRYKKALSMLLFPEVQELCLGYTAEGTGGSGSGAGLGAAMAQSMWAAVQAGLTELTHFEEVCLFEAGIGADRISDIACGLLRHRLAEYTSDVCVRHEIPVEEMNYPRGRYDLQAERWVSGSFRLPRNPETGVPILLVPARYLRELPTINALGFWDYCFANENATIRAEFGYDISRNVDKGTIVRLARRHPEFVTNYTARCSEAPPRAYDFARDPRGMVAWYAATREFVAQHPLALSVLRSEDFEPAIAQMVSEFKRYVEQNRGRELLWNDDGTARGERAAQNLFQGVVVHYCRANDIDLSRESDIGRGPVDFKVSHGYALRALLELKLAKNTKFWHGLRTQLPVYLKAEDIRLGYFIPVIQTEADLARLKEINAIAKEVGEASGCRIEVVAVDGQRDIPSASRA